MFRSTNRSRDVLLGKTFPRRQARFPSARLRRDVPMGKVVQKGDQWFWQRSGNPDVLLSHNEWGKKSPEQDFPKLAHVLMQLDEYLTIAKTALVKEYHEIWQDGWSHGFDFDLTAAEFAEKIVFESVHYPSAQFLHSHFELSFGDSGLFLGHGFVAVFKLDGTLDHVEMFG